MRKVNVNMTMKFCKSSEFINDLLIGILVYRKFCQDLFFLFFCYDHDQIFSLLIILKLFTKMFTHF